MGQTHETDDDKAEKRSRARDTGKVVPLGVEISAELHAVFKEVQSDKKWSKRTLVEEALKAFFAGEGRWPSGKHRGKHR